MYKYIVNPETNRKVIAKNNLGQSIIKKYLEYNLINNSNKFFKQNGGMEQNTCSIDCISNIFGDFKAPNKLDSEILNKNMNVNNTYGTITPNGVQKLIQYLDINKYDTFLDLGSGIGNVVIQFTLNSPIEKSNGIEFLKTRYNKSLEYLTEFKKIFKQKLNNVNFINGDINDYIINENIVFTCSTCFPEHLMDIITSKCEENKNLKYLITQKKIKENTKLDYVGNIDLECSWNSKCIHHIYTNNNSKLII